MMTLRSIMFTFLIPGTVTGLIPYQLSRAFPELIALGVFRFVGITLMLVGLTVYVLCVSRFLTEGGGTPTMWFTKPIRFLMGEEPSKVVTSGLYRMSRNPMYLGVLTVVLGEAVWFERRVLFVYVAALWLFFHLVVVLIEEPHLKQKMGYRYESYRRSVPRWFGRAAEPGRESDK